ncbi:hypothetical protein CIFRMM205B1_22940 [Citrobacter freundii]|nr:Uncharacterised protein [Kluyvera intermedia]
MRRTFTAEEKASVFELWKNGTGFSEIANILGSKPGTIFTANSTLKCDTRLRSSEVFLEHLAGLPKSETFSWA